MERSTVESAVTKLEQMYSSANQGGIPSVIDLVRESHTQKPKYPLVQRERHSK